MKPENTIVVREKLTKALMHMNLPEGETKTSIEGLSITCLHTTTEVERYFYQPRVAVVVQGQKESLIAHTQFCCNELDCLINGVGVWSVSRTSKATHKNPLLEISLAINTSIAKDIVMDMGKEPERRLEGAESLGVSVAPVPIKAIEAFLRLVELLSFPDRATLIAPLLTQEIITHILMSKQGAMLRHFFTQGTHSHHVAEAIRILRSSYSQPLRVEALAKKVGMPTSTFHRAFKKVTSLSPLQFQKQLRLYEAQRLMLAESSNANNAGQMVGYENTQQFNREYKHMFGEPPLRHIKKLRKKDIS